jgi:hypothetical protein
MDRADVRLQTTRQRQHLTAHQDVAALGVLHAYCVGWRKSRAWDAQRIFATSHRDMCWVFMACTFRVRHPYQRFDRQRGRFPVSVGDRPLLVHVVERERVSSHSASGALPRHALARHQQHPNCPPSVGERRQCLT